MTPIDYYHEQIHKGIIVNDPQQLAALSHLQAIFLNLLKEYRLRKIYAFLRKPNMVNGLYLWGGVGVGKTFIMDCFYHCIPFKKKLRIHFHQFMKLIHEELKKYQGQKNPLEKIAKDLGKKTLVICFDEFFVSDITDAMILARLFKALTSQGICLIMTSNVTPDDLYKKGLQRELFLPTIALIKAATFQYHIPTQQDYRLRHLKSSGAFFAPNDEIAEENMEKCFSILTENKTYSTHAIDICARPIQIKKEAMNVVWFDFDFICSVPRSQHDYLAIAEKYHSVLISNVTKILPHEKNKISLFIRLVDIFYDARIRLICSAEVDVSYIYTEGHMIFEYARTKSRLIEMQSENYFYGNHSEKNQF